MYSHWKSLSEMRSFAQGKTIEAEKYLMGNTYIFMIGLIAWQVSCFSSAPEALQLDVRKVRESNI